MASDQETSRVGAESPEPDLDSVISFILKIWLEEASPGAEGHRWRGRITHVPSGAERYLTGLDEMVAFIVPYLEERGVRPKWWWRIRQRLRERGPRESE
jgi:hypothetical protein